MKAVTIPADDKQTDETQGIKHGGLEGDRAAVEGSSPVEDFYAGGDRHQKTQKGEDEAGVHGLTRDKHVMAPDEETEDSDGDTRIGNEVIAEDFFARKTGNGFADDRHPRQNHDVNRGMRVEPEQVLEEDGVAAEFRVEQAEMPQSFQGHQRQSDSEDRRG